MKVPHIIGADLSKKTIDLASHQLKSHLKIDNNSSGFQDLIRWLKRLKINAAEVMIVMEHTGLYSYKLEQFLYHQSICFTKVSALAIKRSMGLVRGKTDKQDAQRIARYGFEKLDQLTQAKPIDKKLQRLQMLHSTRERLVRNRAGFTTAVKEYQQAFELSKTDPIIAPQLKLIKTLDLEITKLDQHIESLVTEHSTLNENYQLLNLSRVLEKYWQQQRLSKPKTLPDSPMPGNLPVSVEPHLLKTPQEQVSDERPGSVIWPIKE